MGERSRVQCQTEVLSGKERSTPSQIHTEPPKRGTMELPLLSWAVFFFENSRQRAVAGKRPRGDSALRAEGPQGGLQESRGGARARAPEVATSLKREPVCGFSRPHFCLVGTREGP